MYTNEFRYPGCDDVCLRFSAIELVGTGFPVAEMDYRSTINATAMCSRFYGERSSSRDNSSRV